jgi:hypothetical protein
MQELLEKFEFFPLKCHVQRALETFKINQGRRDRPPKLKMKVCINAQWPRPLLTAVARF